MNFIKKWYTYQKERFPVLAYGSYVLAIVVATYCCTVKSANLNMVERIVEDKSSFEVFHNQPWIIAIMFLVGIIQFLMVRVVDEFKDYEEDCKYRPYRPVPRGLVSLKELKVVLVGCAVLQVVLTAAFSFPVGLINLLLLWVVFGLMTKGFFIKKYLDKHLLAEVTLDEIMMPFMVLYFSSFVWNNTFLVLIELFPFLIMTYFVSWLIEIARKVRCKEDEEEGVRTYTAVYGIPKAVGLVFILETILLLLPQTIFSSFYMNNQFGMYKWIYIAAFVIVNLFNVLFLIEKKRKYAKLVELMANILVFVLYFSMILVLI